MSLPQLPAPHGEIIPYLASHPKSVQEAVQPYREYESALREVYAQDRQNPLLDEPMVNLVPVFDGHEHEFITRARDRDNESQKIKDKYLLQLAPNDRRADKALAITPSFRDFRKNFNVFSESSLIDLDWNNVVVAGSAAVTPLLPVPTEHNASKRALREYYHEKLAPASDVDLFLYGLTEEQAKEKISQIEASIRDTILYETTTVRTKYAITIASQYPCRHVQIVLRLYKNVSEILTSFDVDSAAVAYDGKQVYATPRAISAFMTQTNVTDLSRRSPSYENRLSKYSRRGFEVFVPTLDRSRVDPTIFERSFGRVLGLARLLVLEKLPSPDDRDSYLSKRREERGRPELPWHLRMRQGLYGNIKDEQPDEVSEWVGEEEVSSYHTFTVPYGPKFYAKKIEKLLFTKDLLLNAEWNKSKDRTVDLHRHPAFFGAPKDVFGDCCGTCPQPVDEEEMLVAEKEAEIYIKGPIKFVVDNPGRQQIGSFNPLTEDDWTEQAYVGNTTRLCQAIVDGDVDHVKDWCAQEGADPNRRDHTGRTPLHLATQSGTAATVQCLIDHGARITRRLVDGRTALHIAAQRGDPEIVNILIKTSDQNEEEAEERHDRRIEKMRAKQGKVPPKKHEEDEEEEEEEEQEENDSDPENIDEDEIAGSDDEITQGSFVRVKSNPDEDDPKVDDDDDDEPDFYDPNLLAWDYRMSPLHMAIVNGHVEVVRMLVDSFGADVLLPVKIKDAYSEEPTAAILTLVLAARFAPNPPEISREVLQRGASSSQADMHEISALHYIVNARNQTVLDLLLEYDGPAAKAAIKHFTVRGSKYSMYFQTPLITAIDKRDENMVKKLLQNGAPATIALDTFVAAYHRNIRGASKDPDEMKSAYESYVMQPIIQAVCTDQPNIVRMLIEHGADVNTLTRDALIFLSSEDRFKPRRENVEEIGTALDLVRGRQLRFREKAESEDDGEGDLPNEIEELHDDSHYLQGLNSSSYQFWAAKADLQLAKHIVEVMKDKREEQIRARDHSESSDQKEREGYEKVLVDFGNLERSMLEAGARTFKQLYPEKEIEPKKEHTPYYHHRNWKEYEGPYKTELRFMAPHLSDAMRGAYLALFEAAWTGNEEMTKALTLAEWTPATFGGEDMEKTYPPLNICVEDSRGFTAFSIAAVRGHLALADIMLDIAMLQYQPADNQPKYRYSLEGPAEDADSASEMSVDDDHVRVHRRLIDQKYTVQSVAELASTVESKVTPVQLICEQAQMHSLMDSYDQATKLGLQIPPWHLTTPYNAKYEKFSQGHLRAAFADQRHSKNDLFRYAIAKNDIGLLTWLMERQERYIAREGRESNDMTNPRISRDDFKLCMRLDRTEMIGEIIKCTGIQLPVKSLVEKSGIEVKERSKFYQGLTVYGRKRKDWADRSRGIVAYQRPSNDTPPLLDAAFYGSLESIEYCLGDAPLRNYEEYVANRPDDAAIEALRKEKGGISKTIGRWLNSRNQMAVHGAVMKAPKRQETKDLDFLITSMPHAIDGLNSCRETPLHLAFQFKRLQAARRLIRAGANQAARNSNGENVMHLLIDNSGYHTVEKDSSKDLRSEVLEAFISLLDKSLVSELLLQRTNHGSGSHTPLSSFLRLNHRHDSTDSLKILLKYGGGKELELMDAAGDYPLHYVVREAIPWATKVIVEHNPALLFRENAVGLTPLEIVENSGLHYIIDNAPRITRRGDPSCMNAPVLTRKKTKQPNPIRETQETCLDAARSHPHPRKLVSLVDATEVAKRLADKHSSDKHRTPRAIVEVRRYDEWNQEVHHHVEGEMSQWTSEANSAVPWDVLKYLAEKGYNVKTPEE